MTGRMLAEVVLKTWGAYQLLTTAISTPMLLVKPSAQFEPGLWFALILTAVIGAACGICLIVWGGRIAYRIIPDGPPLNIDVDMAGLQIVGFALVGLITLIEGLKDAAVILLPILAKPGWAVVKYEFVHLWKNNADFVISTGVELAAATFLLLRREGIVRFWLTLRGRDIHDEG